MAVSANLSLPGCSRHVVVSPVRRAAVASNCVLSYFCCGFAWCVGRQFDTPHVQKVQSFSMHFSRGPPASPRPGRPAPRLPPGIGRPCATTPVPCASTRALVSDWSSQLVCGSAVAPTGVPMTHPPAAATCPWPRSRPGIAVAAACETPHVSWRRCPPDGWDLGVAASACGASSAASPSTR